jgi:23S rRNA (guanosine2251-2'-O)-methyltransferase
MRKLSTEELLRIDVDTYRSVGKRPIVAVLDNIRSALNVGSVFRTADAFRCERVLLCGYTAQPPNRDLHKTALGAEESVPWEHYESTEAAALALAADGYILLAVEQTNESIELGHYPILPHQSYALIFGNEVTGVTTEVLSLCQAALEIPQAGTKHSLNVSVAAGIVLYHFAQQVALPV